MPDDTSEPGGQDGSSFSLGEEYEVRDWRRKFGLTRAELEAAVKVIDNHAAAVEARLISTRR